MDINEIFELLDSCTMRSSKINENRKYNAAMLLTEQISFHFEDEDVIYFTKASTFNSLNASALGGRTFFLWLDEPLKTVEANTLYAAFTEQRQWSSALEILAYEFRVLQQMRERIIGLMQKVSANAGIESILNEAADIIGAPCSLIDNSLSFIGVSNGFPEWAARRTNETTGIIPEDGVAKLREEGLLISSRNSPQEVSIFQYGGWPDFYDGATFVNHFVPIRAGNSTLGSVSFFTKGKQLRQSRIDLLPAIGRLLSAEMQKSNTYTLNKATYYAYLFEQLESGGMIGSKESIEKQFSLFGYKLRTYLHIYVVDLSRELTPINQTRLLAEQIHPHIHNSIYIVKERSLVFLESSEELSEHGHYNSGSISRLLASGTARVGVSGIFMNPMHIPSYIEEAHRAIAVGRKLDPERMIYPFAEYRLLDLIDSVADKMTLYSYRYPPLMHVIDLDMKKDTDLAWTLYLYLRDPSHPDKVADELFVHKNTLYYRLGKIREIMGRDFKDADTITNITMAFNVLKIQGKFNDLVRRQNVSGGDTGMWPLGESRDPLAQ